MPTTLSPADKIARDIARCERNIARFNESLADIRRDLASGFRSPSTTVDEAIDDLYERIAEAIARRAELKAQATV